MVRAVLEVKLVGGGSATDLIGPILVAGAAVTAAAVAARTANRRQRLQLEHDRFLRAHEHVRDTIDAAVENVIDAIKSATRLEVLLDFDEGERDRHGETLANVEASSEEQRSAHDRLVEIKRELELAAEEASGDVSEVIASHSRLRLRLGASDPIVEHLRALASLLVVLEGKLQEGVERNRDDEQKKLAKEADDSSTEEFRSFLDACESWFVNPDPTQ